MADDVRRLTGGREAHGRIPREVAALVDQGRLRPLIDPERFTRGRIAAADAKREAGRALGKLGIDIG